MRVKESYERLRTECLCKHFRDKEGDYLLDFCP